LIGLGLLLSVVGILVQFYTAISPIYRAFLSGLTPAGGITLVHVELYAAKDRRQGKMRNEELKRELNAVKIRPLVVDQCSAWMLGYYMVMCEAGQGPRIGDTDIAERACQCARELGIGDEDLYKLIRSVSPQLRASPAAVRTVAPEVALQVNSRLVDPVLKQCYTASFEIGTLFFGLRQGISAQSLEKRHAHVIQMIDKLYPQYTANNPVLSEAIIKLKPLIASVQVLGSSLKPVAELLESVQSELQAFLDLQTKPVW